MQLKHIDKDVLEKIRDKLQFDGNIYHTKLEDGRESYYLRVCRRDMVNDLGNLGMPLFNKTFTTSYPDDLPTDYFWDFMRGVTEGDGNLKHGKRWNDLTVSIFSASPQFLPAVQARLYEYDINTTIIERPPGTSGSKEVMYILRTKANADALRWCFLMYRNTDTNFRLARKFEIFRNYVEGYYDRNRRSKPSIQMIETIRKEIPECSDSEKDVA